ncbi:chromosome partitioning protein ParA [Mangrovimonas aestuarii]|uniref:chromosome partitioning protein ParA n=1 Tax=Mangrovimonas aestuarii TaxID=3018443 RepID=UPI002379AEFC|nr:chromosome partitioning protein ParA [Mangrovimonas aestuarii]
MENSKSNTGLKVGLGIALALFLGVTFYTTSLYNEKKKNEAKLVAEKELILKDLTNSYDQLKKANDDNEIKNAKLEEAQSRIQGLIDSLKISENNVQSLWKYKQKYISLQKEMNALLDENETLKIENSYLAATLDSTNMNLENQKMFNDSLLVQNTALAEVMENAAVLGTVGLKGFGVIERSSGKLVPTERARRSDKIRVCFTVAKNNLVQAGEQELYVQVIDPKNNILGANEQVAFDEETLNYSVISKFNYENANLNVCEFVTTQAEEFEKGRYIVNVFNEKHLVSTSEFTLK